MGIYLAVKPHLRVKFSDKPSNRLLRDIVTTSPRGRIIYLTVTAGIYFDMVFINISIDRFVLRNKNHFWSCFLSLKFSTVSRTKDQNEYAFYLLVCTWDNRPVWGPWTPILSLLHTCQVAGTVAGRYIGWIIRSVTSRSFCEDGSMIIPSSALCACIKHTTSEKNNADFSETKSPVGVIRFDV